MMKWIDLVIVFAIVLSAFMGGVLAGKLDMTARLKRANHALVGTEETLALTRTELQSVQEQLEAAHAGSAALPACVRVQVGVVAWEREAVMGIGETALCASKAGRLVWVNKMYGPVFNEADSLAEAWNEASRWRDCAEDLQYCPEGYERVDNARR